MSTLDQLLPEAPDGKLLDACELVRTLLESSPSEILRFVRVGIDGVERSYGVRMRILRSAERIAALCAAQEFAKQHQEDQKQYSDLYKEAQAHEVVARALCHVEPRERPDGTKYFQPVFTSAEQLRQSFTEDEILRCLNMYTLVGAKYGGLMDFNENDVDMWASRLSDAIAGPFFLSRLDSLAWPGLTLSLARRVAELSESLSRPLPNWRVTSESDLSSSDPGTGSFTESSSAYSENGSVPIPSDRPMSREDARALAPALFGKPSK